MYVCLYLCLYRHAGLFQAAAALSAPDSGPISRTAASQHEHIIEVYSKLPQPRRLVISTKGYSDKIAFGNALMIAAKPSEVC